ncbi:MAG: phosphate acyltransferase PlsX [Candidatus Omnitrophica bacterium]|nr:phosphate acyltransferase PlsX [Candidatus Omnitrophota bacterium]
MKIAVDAMGGDHAPAVVVEGAIAAAHELPYEIVLVGAQDSLEEHLSRHKGVPKTISVYHAPESIGMNESPALSIRKKRNASINVAVRLAQEKKVEAVVSAGNTGAFVCAATLYLRLLPGIERAGIGVLFPTLKGMTLLIDAGANIDAKPSHLCQYGIMGDAFYRYILGCENPKVGLLNVGEEDAKGTDFIKETYKLLEDAAVKFVGNVEGHDLFRGECEVIVCDGFAGNVALKVSESLAETMGLFLKTELSKGLLNRLGALLSFSAFRALREKMDYAEYGGAPLLGIDGTCIICHGSSSGKAIKNAIRLAGYFINRGVNTHILEALHRH